VDVVNPFSVIGVPEGLVIVLVMVTVATALAILVVLPIASTYHAIARWLPSALVNAPADLVNGTQHLSHFVPSLAVSVAASAAALLIAVRRLAARET